MTNWQFNNITYSLVEHIYDLHYESMPSRVVDKVIELYIDYLSSAIAGYLVNNKFNKVIETVVPKTDYQSASILFHKEKDSVYTASFLNSLYGHGADIDDGNKKAAGHVGTVVFPCAIALAEQCHATYRDVTEAVVAGYEVFCRIAASVMPGMIDRGFHSTGMAGAIASATVASKLMKLDKQGIYSAISMASTMSSGLLIVGETGQEVKPLNPAHATIVGIFAANVARRGIIGPKDPLESKKGWMHAVSDTFDPIILNTMGSEFAILDTYTKQYPCCRHTHSVLDIAKMFYELGTDINEIKAINVTTYLHAIELAGQIKTPQSSGEAKFSIYYALAIMLTRGRFKFDDLNVSTIDSKIISLINKTQLIANNQFEDLSKGIRGAEVEIILKSGSHSKKTVLYPKGEPENPFSRNDIVNKFDMCVSLASESAFSFERAESFIDGQFAQWSYPDRHFKFPFNQEFKNSENKII